MRRLEARLTIPDRAQPRLALPARILALVTPLEAAPFASSSATMSATSQSRSVIPTAIAGDIRNVR